MIDGLKLTMTGVQLRSNLEDRIRWHQGDIRRMARQLKNPHRDVEECPYPDTLVEAEIARGERQIEVLTFIRDYIVPDEVYLLGEFDLRFADLLPETEEWDGGCCAADSSTAGDMPSRNSEPH